MRVVFCHYCPRPIRGHGTTRVLSKIVFHFCAGCWSRRSACEAFMRRVAGLPDPGAKGETGSSRAAGPANQAGFPETLGRYLASLPDPLLACSDSIVRELL
jgi:hypothetical protein